MGTQGEVKEEGEVKEGTRECVMMMEWRRMKWKERRVVSGEERVGDGRGEREGGRVTGCRRVMCVGVWSGVIGGRGGNACGCVDGEWTVHR